MKHIILMGFMGCGKSSVGVRLSYKLQKAFLDTDNLIEKMEGMPISNIFDTYGEAYFREKETEVLAALKQEKADRIIPKQLWIDYTQIRAWFVCDGGIEECMDTELQLIQNEKIDEISQVINQDFDDLLDMQNDE